MKKFVFIVCVAFLSVHLAYSAGLAQDRLSFNSSKEREICNSIQGAIKDGLNTKQVVVTGIKLGHSACLVVRCAIEGGGDLKEVITGAIEAGATSDVVSRCAVDAGADPQEVGGYILLAGLPDSCYLEPQRLEERELENPQGEETGGGFLSPSSP